MRPVFMTRSGHTNLIIIFLDLNRDERRGGKQYRKAKYIISVRSALSILRLKITKEKGTHMGSKNLGG